MTSGRRLSNWLAHYVQIAEISESPNVLHLWTGISILSSITQRKTYFDMGTFKYIPNFYIIFVGPAGLIQKSTTISPAKRFLLQFKKQNIHLSKDATTWQDLMKVMSESANRVVYPDSPDGRGLNFHAMSIVASELGVFLDLKNPDLVNLLISLWDCPEGPVEKGTKTQGSDLLLNPVLNMLGGTTPDWVQANFEEFMVGGGFTSRCIFIYADKKSKRIPFPHLHAEEIGFDYKAWERDLLHDLGVIVKLKGGFRMTPEAHEFGLEFYDRIQDDLERPGISRDLQTFYGRKQGHVIKLAMVISLSERDDLLIDRDTLQRAWGIVDLAETSRAQVLGNIGQTRESKIIADVKRILSQYPNGVTFKYLWEKLSRQADQRTIENALNMGVRGGLWRQSGNKLVKIGEKK